MVVAYAIRVTILQFGPGSAYIDASPLSRCLSPIFPFARYYIQYSRVCVVSEPLFRECGEYGSISGAMYGFHFYTGVSAASRGFERLEDPYRRFDGCRPRHIPVLAAIAADFDSSDYRGPRPDTPRQPCTVAYSDVRAYPSLNVEG